MTILLNDLEKHSVSFSKPFGKAPRMACEQPHSAFQNKIKTKWPDHLLGDATWNVVVVAVLEIPLDEQFG